MAQQVAIVATGQTKHRSRRADVSVPELVREAVDEALAEAQITMKDIDAIVIGNMEHFEGINLSEQWAGSEIGLGKPVMKIATGGTTGSSLGATGSYHVASGLFETVLIVGWEKQSEGETTTGIVTAFDPIFERPALAGAIGGLALDAAAYMYRYGITQEQAALAAIKSRRNALLNPKAHLRKELTVQDVMESFMLCWPIKLWDMCPQSDGACAVIMTNKDGVKRFPDQPAWIAAVTSRHNHPFLCDLGQFIGDELADIDTLESAIIDVYKRAGITNPRKELDCIELYEPCSFAELKWSEEMHLCEPGQGGQLIESGATQISGDIPINASGGVMSTNPIGATGLIRLAEASMQIRGKAGAHQVHHPVKTAMSTGFGGSNWHEAFILKSEV